jgi:phenylalanyl-tRNA synthetase beta chain
MTLDLSEIEALLAPLEFRCERKAQSALRVTVPEHRLDCQYPADLVEEIARMYGYDRIPITEMADRLPPPQPNRSLVLEEEVRDLLVGCGLQEVITYALTTPAREAALDPSGSASADGAPTYVTLANPISQERVVMRRSLWATVLESAAANLRFREGVKVFELGKVFLGEHSSGEGLPAEVRRLAIVLCGQRGDRHWLATSGPELDYFDLKGVAETVLERLHIQGAVYEPVDHPSLQPGRAARLRVGEANIGVLGELHPAVREAFELPVRRVAVADLDLDLLLSQVPATWLVAPISAYPAVLQDLAVVVDEDVPAAAVATVIADAGGFLLKEARLFDLYHGEQIPAGKKSLAYALTFQAPDKTLSDALVARQVGRIAQRLKKELGAELRR